MLVLTSYERALHIHCQPCRKGRGPKAVTPRRSVRRRGVEEPQGTKSGASVAEEVVAKTETPKHVEEVVSVPPAVTAPAPGATVAPVPAIVTTAGTKITHVSLV